MNYSKPLVTLFLLISSPLAAQELPQLKPGAWQHEMIMGNGIPPQKSAHCVTEKDSREVMKMLQMPDMPAKCDLKNSATKGDTYSWETHCQGTLPGGMPLNMTGGGSLTKQGEKAFLMKMNTSMETPMGPVKNSFSIKGTYLGEDCKAFNAKTLEESMSEAKQKLEAIKSKYGNGMPQQMPQGTGER